MSMFDNPIVKEMNEKLKKIDESLSISKTSGYDNKIRSVGLSLYVKGNAEIIKKLERMGFEKIHRQKRNDGFVQEMEYHINYDKYAIYQGEIGKYALLYIDNIYDFKRCGIFGNPYDIEFPIVVNRSGGRHTFDKRYEDNFIEIKEVLEDEEPLTREEMYPKNSDKFVYGWIDREGNTYACSFESHYRAAEAICEEQRIPGYNPESDLEKLGWIKISRKAPYTPDNVNSRCIYFNFGDKKATQAQINTLFDMGLDSDRHFKYMLNELDNN